MARYAFTLFTSAFLLFGVQPLRAEAPALVRRHARGVDILWTDEHHSVLPVLRREPRERE